MPEVSVDSNSILQAKKLCLSAEKEMKGTISLLNKGVSSVSVGWKDQKAKEFESIVNQCIASLKQPLDDLHRCDTYLQRLGKALEEYDSISFSGTSNKTDNSSGGSESSLFGNLAASARNRSAIRASVNSASHSSPRDLSQTQYGFEPMMIGGQQCMMYNKPMDTAQSLIRNQGQNSRNMAGTCGLCQCANTLRLAGVTSVTEDDVINVALSCSENTREGLDIDNPDPDERGGTTVAGRREILSRYNLQTDVYQISSDRNEAVSHLAQQVSSGHGVIISADAGVLWNDSRYLGGGHAVSLISVSESGDRFIYSDTGTGRIGVISANRLGQALTGRPANVTRNIIR